MSRPTWAPCGNIGSRAWVKRISCCSCLAIAASCCAKENACASAGMPMRVASVVTGVRHECAGNRAADSPEFVEARQGAQHTPRTVAVDVPYSGASARLLGRTAADLAYLQFLPLRAGRHDGADLRSGELQQV